MKYFILLSIIAILSLDSCKKYEPVYDPEFQTLGDTILDVVYVHNDILHITNQYFIQDQIISSASLNFNKMLRLSPDKRKVAYMNTSNNIIIMNLSDGSIEATLTQYNTANDMDWTTDSKTLYILQNNQIFQYGDPLMLPNQPLFQFPVNATDRTISSISISPNGTVASAFRYKILSTFQGYNYYTGVQTKPISGSTIKMENISTIEYEKIYKKLRYHATEDRFIVNYLDNEQNWHFVGFVPLTSGDITPSGIISDFSIGLLSAEHAIVSPKYTDQFIVPISNNKLRSYFSNTNSEAFLEKQLVSSSSNIIPIDWR